MSEGTPSGSLGQLVSARVEIRLLGNVDATVDSGPVAIPGVGLKALVAMLSLAAPHPVTTGNLVDELWGEEQPGNPDNALQARVSHLRKIIGRELVLRTGTGYALVIDPDAIDAIRLEQLVRHGRVRYSEGDQEHAGDCFGQALTLVRGTPFSELLDFRFARAAAARLEELVLVAHEGLADVRLSLGRHADAVAPLRELVRDNPLRERFHAQLMIALYRCGRQADALGAYQAARAVLLDELGLEPGPELRALEQQVLNHDPALAYGTSRTSAMPLPVAMPTQRDLEARRTGADDDGTDPGPDRHRFVGRIHELRTLNFDLDEAIAGRGRTILLAGEPGIGKTRLAEELAADAEAMGVAVIWARCYEGRGAPAFWPWSQALTGLLAIVDHDTIRATLASDAPEIAQIAPDFSQFCEGMPPVSPADPELARFRLYQAITAFIRRLAARRALLLIIDDLHWADQSSMELLTFLTSATADVHLAVAATFRNVDPTISDPLSSALAELARRPTVRRVELAGLDRSALSALLTTGGQEPSDELVSTIHLRTQGNPFFVTEVLRLLPSEGSTIDARSVGRVVPAGVGGVIRQRLARLPEETRRALTAAAILGHDFDLGISAAILDTDAPTLLDRLEPAVVAGVIVNSPEGVGRYRFCHGLVAETIYEDMGVGQRARTHLRAAQALELRHGDADGPHLIAIAEHWYRAVPAASPDPGIKFALRSAKWAIDHVAHQQAEEQFRVALDLLIMVPESRQRSILELSLQDQLSGLLITTKGYSTPGIEEACARMRELCSTIDDLELLLPALWRLTVNHCVRLELATAVQLGNQLLHLGATSDAAGALLAGHMALGCANTQLGNFAGAQVHLDTARSLCADGHDRSIAGVVLETPAVWSTVFAAWNTWMMGDEERADQLAIDGIAVGVDDNPHGYGTTFANWFSTLIAVLSQRADIALQRSDHGIPQAMADGFRMFVPMMSAARGWSVASLGDPDSGAAEMDMMCAAMDDAGIRMLRHFWLGLRADVELMAGRYETAIEVADRGLADVEETNERWYEAELHRLRGEALRGSRREAAALEEFDMAIAIAERQGAAGLKRRAEISRTATSLA